jgi:hypothetical protein
VPWWVWLLIVVVILLVGGGAAAVYLGGLLGNAIAEPARAVQRFYQDLDAGKCADARAMLSMASMPSSDALCSAWNQLKSQGTTTTGSTNNINTINNRSTIVYNLQAGGSPFNTTLTVEKSGTDWFITGANPGLLPNLNAP